MCILWNLTEVKLPASLEYVEGDAFGNCTDLKFIECNSIIPPDMHPDAFINSDLTGITLYVGVVATRQPHQKFIILVHPTNA
jgi:hypothetical protein